MNILASYSWIKEYLKYPVSPEMFAKRMSASGMSVEYRHDLKERFANMVVGKIVRVRPHPNADRLRVVLTDLGDSTEEIVCGGSNLEEGHLVAVALPGALVRWHGAQEETRLERATIRGVKSAGMICAPEEIGFSKLVLKGTGVLIWDLTDLVSVKAGTPLAKALGLEDTLFDIEVTTNRPDAMSIVGLAREAGAVEAGTFVCKPLPMPKGKKILPLHVQVSDKRCVRYQAVAMEDVHVGPSPWWLQARLLLAGHRPINNVVDITNYVLHELGQPMHAFDYDMLEGQKIVVRAAGSGENLRALDGKTYSLTPQDLVIADAKRPVAIAGVMGGEETGTTEATTRIVFECATFDPVSVRRSARTLNLFSDSQQLFEKGLSPHALPMALARAVRLAEELCGARVASPVVDVYPRKAKTHFFFFSPEEIQARVGIAIPVPEQKRILTSLGFTLKKAPKGFRASVPFWRDHDIEDAVDFSEEIARVYGFHRLPAILPSGNVSPLPEDPELVWEGRVKKMLEETGATELFHYSFTSEANLLAWGERPEQALRFLNPLSEDHRYLRRSLIPSVLRTIEVNQGEHPTDLVFELAHVYLPRAKDLPEEVTHLVVAGFGEGHNGVLHLKGVLERLFGGMGIREWSLVREDIPSHWHATRSARVCIGSDDVGYLGELCAEDQKRFGIQDRVAMLSLAMPKIIARAQTTKSFTALPQFPNVKRDVAFLVDRLTSYADVRFALLQTSALLRDVMVFDVFEGAAVPVGKKSMALHLEFRADDRTLTSEEVEGALSTLVGVLQKTFSATMRT